MTQDTHRQQIEDMAEPSMADNVKALGYDPNVFIKEVLHIDDLLCFDYSKKNLINKVYPYLNELKNKYGISIPLSLTGVDMIRLDTHIRNMVAKR